jgi:glycosyltransferase involved in cell wall biosynthesis
VNISIATGPWLPIPTVQGGAVPRIWQGLAEEFAARGHQVKMLCRSYPGQPHTEFIRGVEYIRWGGFPQSPNVYVDLLKDLLYALLFFPKLPTADILVINDFWLPVFAALRPKVGKIVINANRFPKGQYQLYARTTFFAAASQAIQDAIAQQYPTAIPRMRVIPNPIDTQIFSPSPLAKKIRQEKVILYVGRLHPEKGIHLLLDAFAILSKQLPHVKLRIVGPAKGYQGGGGEDYLKILKLKATRLNVDFLGPIFDLPQLVNVYQDADLFCYPSLAEKGESFGVAPLEAMATGLVPVVSELACFKDFIKDHETGYFFNHRTPQAAENLAFILASAISKWEVTCAMSTKARQIAQEYSYEKVAEFYLKDFEMILKNNL